MTTSLFNILHTVIIRSLFSTSFPLFSLLLILQTGSLSIYIQRAHQIFIRFNFWTNSTHHTTLVIRFLGCPTLSTTVHYKYKPAKRAQRKRRESYTSNLLNIKILMSKNQMLVPPNAGLRYIKNAKCSILIRALEFDNEAITQSIVNNEDPPLTVECCNQRSDPLVTLSDLGRHKMDKYRTYLGVLVFRQSVPS